MKACVDIGGTKVAVSLALGSGTDLSAKRSEPTAKTGGNDAVAVQILRLIGEACDEAGRSQDEISKVGISSCGPFVVNDGCVELAAPNICGGIAGPQRGLPNDWTTALLEAPVRDRFAQVRVENDCVAALEAERRWGALHGFRNCGYLTWSTGIGWGFCVDGHVLRGKNGNAGHAGHMFVSDNNDALCGCGNIGDLESLVAGNAMSRRFGRDAAALMDAAKAGEAAAAATVDELCRIMGRAVYNAVVILDLERISVGGSVFWHHRDYLLPRVMSHVTGHMEALTSGFELVPAGLADKVGDLAALALVA